MTFSPNIAFPSLIKYWLHTFDVIDFPNNIVASQLVSESISSKTAIASLFNFEYYAWASKKLYNDVDIFEENSWLGDPLATLCIFYITQPSPVIRLEIDRVTKTYLSKIDDNGYIHEEHELSCLTEGLLLSYLITGDEKLHAKILRAADNTWKIHTRWSLDVQTWDEENVAHTINSNLAAFLISDDPKYSKHATYIIDDCYRLQKTYENGGLYHLGSQCYYDDFNLVASPRFSAYLIDAIARYQRFFSNRTAAKLIIGLSRFVANSVRRSTEHDYAVVGDIKPTLAMPATITNELDVPLVANTAADSFIINDPNAAIECATAVLWGYHFTGRETDRKLAAELYHTWHYIKTYWINRTPSQNMPDTTSFPLYKFSTNYRISYCLPYLWRPKPYPVRTKAERLAIELSKISQQVGKML